MRETSTPLLLRVLMIQLLFARGANGAAWLAGWMAGWPLRLLLITDASHSDVRCLPLSSIVVLITGVIVAAAAAAASASGYKHSSVSDNDTMIYAQQNNLLVLF